MKKIAYNFLHSKASKRIISGITAIVMMFGVFPVNEINEEFKGLRSQYLSASAESETTDDDDPIYTHVPADSNKISVKIEDLVSYSEACAKYHKYHKDDELTILGSQGDTLYFQAGFKGLGTSTYPFGGSVTIENNANVTINLDAPLFNYVYDDVALNGSNYINISREYDGGRSDIAHNTPILAQNVLHRNGGASWKVNVSKPSDNQDGLSYNLSVFGGMIGTMEDNASLSVDITMNTSGGDTEPAVIDGYDSLGFACGTMKSGANLTFTMSSDRKIADINTTSGNVGGLVGTIETGAIFTYNGINNQNATKLIKTESGYAGGIVGSNSGTVTLNLPSGTTSYTVDQYIEGTSGAGGVYGYYSPSEDMISATVHNDETGEDETLDNSFNTGNYNIDCQVNGNGYAGGLFGVLDTAYDVTINGEGTVTVNHNSGDCTAYGGLIGQYKADALSRSLTIGTVTANPSKGGNATYYGGGIGQIESTTPSYVKFNGFTVNKAYNAGGLTFGGLVASADNAFVDAANVTVAVDGTFKGGAMIGHTESGILRMSGSTDISGAKSAEPIINDTTDESIYVGQLVGYRNNALVFAADDNWSLVRYDGDVSVDDIGAWGEVLRYSSVLTVDETAHTVKVNSPSSSYTSIGSKSDFVISALDFQFDETALLSFTTTHTDISNSDISITSNISLSGTGITGLTRDNDIGSTGAKCTYSGTITGNKITLAIGEPYGSEITSHDKEGRGKIYRHSYNGLVGIANNVEYSGVQFDGSVDVSAQKAIFVGTAAAQAKGTFTASSVKTLTALKMSIDGSSVVYAGRMIGCCTTGIAGITVSGSEFDGKLTGSNNADATCFGGVIGKITHASNTDLDWSFSTVSLKGEVSNTATKAQRIGGLIAEINGFSSDGDLRTIILNGVTINGLKVSGKVNDNSQGGLLGYSWLNTNVDVTSVTLSNSPTVSMTGAGYTAGLVYRATGHWTVTSLDMSGINMIAPNAGSIGMIVNKGVSNDNDKQYTNDSKSAIYLELLSADAYTLSWGSQKSLPSERADYVFDELCAYSAAGASNIMRNGNGIISVPTSGLKMETTAEDSLSYDAQTTEGETANPNTRYYYNLHNIDKGKTLSADAEKLMAWGVRQYACKNLTGCFADPSFSNNTIPNATYSMKGYSWYPVTVDDNVTISGTFKLFNKEFELCEAMSSNTWSSLSQGTAATQHYMLHNGLFYNMNGKKTLTVNNVTLQGNVGKISDGSGSVICGFLICGTAQGSSATNKASVSINGLTLDGAYIHDISSSDYAPLIINNIGSHTNLNVKNVSTNNTYKSMTATSYPGLLVDSYPKAASSLIGNVGLDTSATGLSVEFSAIRLDGRTSAVDDTNGFNTELDNAYGTERTIFTAATLLNKFQYDSGSNGKYDYKLNEDWNSEHHYSEDSEHNKTYLGVTYGKEVGYKDTDTNTEYPGKERIYIEGNRYTNPIDGNDATGTYLDFNGFLPYVATAYNKTNKTHQLKINHGATVLSGCGTYNDPYILASGDLETVAGIINGGTTGTIILPIKSQSAEYSVAELLSADWDSNGHIAYKWDSSTSKFRQFTTTGETTTYSGTGFNKDTVRQYLAHAYYSLNADVEIADGFVGLGSVEDDTSTTGKYYFRGVIAGNGYTITNKSSEPLIKYSNGSVVKNVNVIVNKGITANGTITSGAIDNLTQNSAGSFPSAKAYGAVIGQVLGGDNIIDTVSVAFTNTTITIDGSKAQLVPVGGYVGVIERGGVYFRGMSSLNATDIQGLTSAVNSHVAENDKQYLYVNPIIGRVINGFAVTESNAYRPYETGTRKLTGGETEQTLTNENGAVTMKNGNKHYSITDISANEEKLGNTSTTLSVPNGQAFFVMSLLVNSGMSNKSLGYSVNNYQVSRWASYNNIGSDAVNTTDSDYSIAHSDLTQSNTSNKRVGWLMHNYTSGTTDISGANSTTITLSNKRYVLPDGYKGIGNIFQNSDYYRMKISTITGNGATVEQGTYYYYYDRDFDYDGGTSNKTGYLPNGNYQGGLGLINYTEQALTINGLYLTGSVKTDLINKDNGKPMTKTCAQIASDNNDAATQYYNYLCAGMLIGTIKADLTATNTVLDNVDVLGISHTGGMAGFLTGGKKLKYTVSSINNGEEDTSVYNSKEIRVHGRVCVGGLIGKTNTGNSNVRDGGVQVDMNKHTFNLTEIVCDTSNSNGTYYNYGVGGFIGAMRFNSREVDSDTNLVSNPTNSFRNIIIGTPDKAQTVKSNGNVLTGGVVGVMNRCKGISIENCDFYNMSVTSKFAAGGLVAFPTTCTPARAVNVNLYSPLGSTIESTNDYAGGLIASSDPRVGDQDGSREFTFDRCLVENYTIFGKEGAGGVIGFRGSCTQMPLIIKNTEVKDCEIKSDIIAGGLAGEIINPLIGYNILLNNVTLSSITDGVTTAKSGHICGYVVKNRTNMGNYGNINRNNSNNTPYIKLTALSRQGTDADMENDIVGNCYFTDNIYGDGGYVIFADYDGKALSNKNDKFSNVTTSGTNVESSDNFRPYVSTSPKFNISASQFLTGDGVSSAFYNASTFKHIIDDITSEKNKRYSYAAALTAEQKKTVTDHISNSAKEYNNYAGLPNFPLLVVDDTDYMAITPMIDDYLHMLTNTTYGYETDLTGVYEVGLHKCIWNGSSFEVNTDTASGCLKKYNSGGKDYFRMTADDVDTGVIPQFTLMDIKFMDPNDSSKVAYHLYVPIYVKKLLQFNFTASFASNTDYFTSAYIYYGNTMFENLGNPVTLKFEYQYTRTVDEWKASINSGDSVLTNYSKSLILNNQTGAWPANTKMVLVDASNGDKRYYLDTPPSGASIDLSDFTSDAERTEHYTPVPLNDLMTVTIEGDEDGKLLKTDSEGTSETLTIGTKSYPATVKGADGKFYAYVSEDAIPSGSERYSVTSVTYPKAERYYLSIFTPKSNDTTIYHYEISSKESFPKPDGDDTWRPNKILNKSQVVHLFIGDLYVNDLTLEVEPRKHGIQLMDKDNNFLTVTMTANISLTQTAKSAGIGGNMGNNLSTSKIYQTFVQTYDMLEDIQKDSEIGIVPEAGLSIGDREGAYYIKAGIITDDTIESDSYKIDNPEYLYDPNKDTQIELRNNENLIGYLADTSNGNAVTLRVKYDLAYSANDLSYQFPKKGEGVDDNIGTKVIGYSNISSSVESAAYSATSERKEDNYSNGEAAGIRYYTADDTKASLNYMVVETKSDPAGPYSYLGKNAVELGNTLSFVDTNAVYDTRNLKNSDEYIELTMELYGKWDNYTSSVAITDYLKNIKIDGIGTNVLFDQTKTDAVQTNTGVKVDTTGGKIRLWVKKDQLSTQADGIYLFPISYDVLTGDEAFNNGGFKYSNYKVSLTAVTCNTLGSTTYSKSSYATDHLIYTNAKVEPSVIK